MELNTTEPLELNEPHFDEEATMLSARPVVPLEEIRTRENSKKRLAFGAAMLFAVIVGALGATLIYKQRGQKQTPVAVETQLPEVDGSADSLKQPGDPAAKSIAEASSGSVPEAEPAESEPAATIRKTPKRVSVASEASEAAPVKAKERARDVNRDSEFEDERELRRAERIEARQMRRRAEWEDMREARRRRRHSEDLLRIRDIFEGPRRRY
jgi:type IV secretory pathway VirB10-like protein